MEYPYEQTVNIILAEVLSSYFGDKTEILPEKSIKNNGYNRFDLLVNYKDIEFVLECLYDKLKENIKYSLKPIHINFKVYEVGDKNNIKYGSKGRA